MTMHAKLAILLPPFARRRRCAVAPVSSADDFGFDAIAPGPSAVERWRPSGGRRVGLARARGPSANGSLAADPAAAPEMAQDIATWDMPEIPGSAFEESMEEVGEAAKSSTRLPQMPGISEEDAEEAGQAGKAVLWDKATGGSSDSGYDTDCPEAGGLEDADLELAEPELEAVAAHDCQAWEAGWSISLVPPSDPPGALPRPRRYRGFDGHWVLVKKEPNIQDWLTSFRIDGDEVVDGIGVRCKILRAPSGPRLCGGRLFLEGIRMKRVGKSGKVQEYRRLGGLLAV
mmetsp:Transcript_123478/g.354786  ORF Transcript_123478/g.354786 Transcript_123478/m.354786 type:complete len:287 (+) Transcript_123478:113-973(+)